MINSIFVYYYIMIDKYKKLTNEKITNSDEIIDSIKLHLKSQDYFEKIIRIKSDQSYHQLEKKDTPNNYGFDFCYIFKYKQNTYSRRISIRFIVINDKKTEVLLTRNRFKHRKIVNKTESWEYYGETNNLYKSIHYLVNKK